MSVNWRIVLASAVGTAHHHTGLPCQDFARHLLLSTDDGPVLVAVICDGAGSALYANVGSLVTATLAIGMVADFFGCGGTLNRIDGNLACEWISRTRAALLETAHDNGHAPRDYASTFLAAIAGETSAAFVQVGDGAIIVSNASEDDWSYVFWPQHGEYANTTNFVVSADAADRLGFQFINRRINALALFSDGLERLVLDHATRTVYQPFFDPMFSLVRGVPHPGCDMELSRQLALYLSSPPVRARTDDDTSLILASRPNGEHQK
jgi:hypothetical protein